MTPQVFEPSKLYCSALCGLLVNLLLQSPFPCRPMAGSPRFASPSFDSSVSDLLMVAEARFAVRAGYHTHVRANYLFFLQFHSILSLCTAA